MNQVNKTDLLMKSSLDLIKDCNDLKDDMLFTLDEVHEEGILNVEHCFMLLDYLDYASKVCSQRIRLYKIQQQSIKAAKFK